MSNLFVLWDPFSKEVVSLMMNSHSIPIYLAGGSFLCHAELSFHQSCGEQSSSSYSCVIQTSEGDHVWKTTLSQLPLDRSTIDLRSEYQDEYLSSPVSIFQNSRLYFHHPKNKEGGTRAVSLLHLEEQWLPVKGSTHCLVGSLGFPFLTLSDHSFFPLSFVSSRGTDGFAFRENENNLRVLGPQGRIILAYFRDVENLKQLWKCCLLVPSSSCSFLHQLDLLHVPLQIEFQITFEEENQEEESCGGLILSLHDISRNLSLQCDPVSLAALCKQPQSVLLKDLKLRQAMDVQGFLFSKTQNDQLRMDIWKHREKPLLSSYFANKITSPNSLSEDGSSMMFPSLYPPDKETGFTGTLLIFPHTASSQNSSSLRTGALVF